MAMLKWLPEALADIERLHRLLYDKTPKQQLKLPGVNYLQLMVQEHMF